MYKCACSILYVVHMGHTSSYCIVYKPYNLYGTACISCGMRTVVHDKVQSVATILLDKTVVMPPFRGTF